MKDLRKLAFFLIMLTIVIWLAKLTDIGITYYLEKVGDRVPVQYARILMSVIHPIFWVIINFYLAMLVFGSTWKDYKLFFVLTIFFGVFALMLLYFFSIKVDLKEFLKNEDKNKAVSNWMSLFLGVYIITLLVSTFSNMIYSLVYPSIYMYFTLKIKILGFLGIILSEVFNIGLGIWMFYVAKKDGQNPIFWSVLGYFQGLLAIIFYFLCIEKGEKTVSNTVSS